MVEFTIRKSPLLVTCPHCKKQHYLGIALIDKKTKIHRGGSQKDKLVKR